MDNQQATKSQSLSTWHHHKGIDKQLLGILQQFCEKVIPFSAKTFRFRLSQIPSTFIYYTITINKLNICCSVELSVSDSVLVRRNFRVDIGVTEQLLIVNSVKHKNTT